MLIKNFLLSCNSPHLSVSLSLCRPLTVPPSVPSPVSLSERISELPSLVENWICTSSKGPAVSCSPPYTPWRQRAAWPPPLRPPQHNLHQPLLNCELSTGSACQTRHKQRFIGGLVPLSIRYGSVLSLQSVQVRPIRLDAGGVKWASWLSRLPCSLIISRDIQWCSEHNACVISGVCKTRLMDGLCYLRVV